MKGNDLSFAVAQGSVLIVCQPIIPPLYVACCSSAMFEADISHAGPGWNKCEYCRQLLKKGKDKYSAALAPLPGSNAAGSGNCSVKWTQSKDKLKVKVYLLGQTQTTGISLNQVIASIPGESAAPQFDLRQVRQLDLLEGRLLSNREATTGDPAAGDGPAGIEPALVIKVLTVSASSSTSGRLGQLA